MVDLMKVTNAVLFWDVSFFRDCHVWDLDAVSSFIVTIYGSSVKGLKVRGLWLKIIIVF